VLFGIARELKRSKRGARLAFGLLLCALPGCTSNELRLHDWTKLPATQYTIPPYAQYLSHYKIALDPGHGGLSHLPNYKRGPTGKEEAVMNLNVALHLREFLRLAGAQVVMTRAEDRFVSLAERAEIAARERCDFMLSLHHNASERPSANHTTVFYHLHPDYSPMSLDLARAVYFGLVEALRLPEISPEGLLADGLIYPAGFGLLRAAKMPAILLESSFFSNPQEEKRLVREAYNRREAYGIFLGLARWAAGGAPSARLLEPEKISRSKTPEILYALADGVSERANRPNRALAVLSESVVMKLDGERVPARLEPARKRLRFQPDSSLRNGAHLVQVDLQNLFKQHNLPRVDTIIIASPPAAITFRAPSSRLPGDGVAMMPIEIFLWDKDRAPVWEGTKVKVAATRGRIANLDSRLQNGRAAVYYQSAKGAGPVWILIEAEAHRDSLALELIPAGESRVLSGFVRDDSTNAALAQARIMIEDSLTAVTDANGFFFAPNIEPGARRFSARRNGYHPNAETITIAPASSMALDVRMRPILNGVVHDQSFILDAAGGGREAGDTFAAGTTSAQASLALARTLADTLQWAGANVVMLRAADTTLTTAARVEAVNKIPRGWYLKLAYRKWERDSTAVQCTIYPGNQAGENLATAINAAFAQRVRTGVILLRNTGVPEVTLTNKTALEVLITRRAPEIAAHELPALFEGLVRFLQQERQRAKQEEAAQ
jgi:N-acetylmuramoyl-L-alanine amidase